jgi:eukaryotic-like serine/threonine-protein kinase
VRLDQIKTTDLPIAVGRYTLTGLLGEGGMARVFAAEMGGELGFKRPVAVKVVLASSPDRSLELQEQLAQEARIGGLLNHPNVVQTLDCGLLDGFPYIAMELVDGLTLSQLVKAGGPLPPGAVLDLAEQACAGLYHAHTASHAGRPLDVIHRDIKPSNLLVRLDGVVKVVDFGIAKASIGDVQLTAEGLTKGTPSYMSPEQLEALELDPRSDIFALGSVIYYALTGRLLFDGGSITEVMMRIATVEKTLERQGAYALVDRLAPGLGDVFRRLMQPHPHQRQPHAAALGSELALVRRGLTAAGPNLGDLVVRRKVLLEKDEPDNPGPTRAFVSQKPGSPSASDLPAPSTIDEPSTPGPTRVQTAQKPDTGTDWMLGDEPAPKKKRKKKRKAAAVPPPTMVADGWQKRSGGASASLVVLGVLAGAVLAVAGWIGVEKLRSGDTPTGPADGPAWLPPMEAEEPAGLAVAKKATPTPRTSDRKRTQPRATPKPRRTPKQSGRAVSPAPTPDKRPTPFARPSPEAKPTPAAKPSPTPKPAAEGVPDPKPTPWKSAGGDAEVPTPDRAPAREKELDRVASAMTLTLKHKAVSRAVVGTKVKLVVDLKGPEDTVIVAFVGPEEGPHNKIVLTHQGKGQWTGSFAVDSSLAGGAVYWLVASHPAAEPSRVLRGSRFQPLRITVY